MNSPAPMQGQEQGQVPPPNIPPTSHQPGVPFPANPPPNGNTY